MKKLAAQAILITRNRKRKKGNLSHFIHQTPPKTQKTVNIYTFIQRKMGIYAQFLHKYPFFVKSGQFTPLSNFKG